MTDRPIPFTQYLFPFGTPQIVTIDRPAAIADDADFITSLGYFFEAEALPSGLVSFTVADRAKEEDIAIEIVRNGPAVPGVVDKLITETAAKLRKEIGLA